MLLKHPSGTYVLRSFLFEPNPAYICLNIAESFEACRISKLRRETSEIGISHKKIGMIDQK